MNNAKKSRPNPTGEQPEGAPGDWLDDPRRSDLSILPPLPDPAVFLPAGENERLIVGFIVYFAIYLYAIVYGMFAWKVTGKVLLPALMLVVFVALISFSDFSGTLDKIQTITRPPGYGPALVMYLWKSLRFGALAAVIGGMIKNLKE